MTKKEFKRAMLCGLGRCVTELQATDDRTQYYDCVMWACRHVLSYDPPSEGMRGYYIWQMINCFDDTAPFLSAILEGFKNSSVNGGWKFAHYCSVLVYFALNGSEEARSAMEETYLRLYMEISGRRNVAAAVCSPLGENFERLCIELIRGGTDAYLRIAHDIGKLYIENRRYKSWDFDWLADCAADMFGKRRVKSLLKNAGKTDPAIEAYLDAKDSEEDFPGEWPAKLTRRIENERDISDPDFLDSSAALNWGTVRTYFEAGGEEAVVRYAEAALAAKKSPRKALMLSALHFAWHKWPLSVERLIECAKTERSKDVREAVFQLLKKTKTEAVHRFAREVLTTSEDSEEKADAIAILLKNYLPDDKELLLKAVYSLPVKSEEAGWHDVVSLILDLFESGNPHKIPAELLTYIYENSLCSFCRAYAVENMSKKRMLTEELLRECLYDCSEKVRRLAARRLSAKISRD